MVSLVAVRASVVAAIGALAVCLFASPAAGHTELISVNPPDGARLDQAPRQVALEFSQEMNPRLSTVTLQVDGGAATTLDVANGRSAGVLVAAIPASMTAEPGSVSRWRAAFRVVSADGHPISGESSFTVLPTGARGATGADAGGADIGGAEAEGGLAKPEAEPESEPDEGGFPWVALGSGASVLLLMLLVVLAAMRLIGRDKDA